MAHALANHVVRKIPAGSCEPIETRRATIPVGRMASADVLIARNITIALVAVPDCPLCLSSSCIALIPNGVAAFARPNMFADRFNTMAPIAGLLCGRVGNNSRIGLFRPRATFSIRPASWAMRIRPRKNAIVPTSPMASSTASLADVITPVVSASIRPVEAASRIEISETVTNSPFSMRSCFGNGCLGCERCPGCRGVIHRVGCPYHHTRKFVRIDSNRK